MVSSLLLSSIVMISFYILFKKFILKRKGLSDAGETSITKGEYSFAVHFYVKILKIFKLNIS